MKRYEEIKKWIVLEEDLTLSDLKKHAGISDFTKPFMKDRRNLKGIGSKSASLIDCIVNKQDNYVKFDFRSSPTYPTQDHKKTIPKQDFKLVKTPVYIQELMIVGFFDWLEAWDGDELTKKDMKDILSLNKLKVFCNCPMYHWQSPNYYMSQEFDGSIYPTNIAPTNIKNSNGTIIGWKARHNSGEALVCKHIDLIISSIDFFLNNMVSMLERKLKDRNYI